MAMAGESVDLHFLGERIKRVHGDVRVLRAESAQMRADLCKLRGEVVGIRADITRIEMRLDALAERVNDRFEELTEWLKSNLRRLESQAATPDNAAE